jgi:hypothetical protein
MEKELMVLIHAMLHLQLHANEEMVFDLYRILQKNDRPYLGKETSPQISTSLG